MSCGHTWKYQANYAFHNVSDNLPVPGGQELCLSGSSCQRTCMMYVRCILTGEMRLLMV